MYKNRFLLLVFIILGISNNSTCQQSYNSIDKAIFGSLHLTSRYDDRQFTSSALLPGISIEYRTNIDSLSDNFNLWSGVSLESVSFKTVGENDGHYRSTTFNISIPLGLYYKIADTYYFGLYSSLDIPFANSEKSDFSGLEYSHTEFSFRYLNINFSAGLNLGKSFSADDHLILVELHFKALGLLGLKSNDYWHYPDDSIPYYTGFRVGYSL